MTSAFLQSELASLIQDSKRKQADVRSAAERSLADLKAISVTSEAQLAADLLRKSQFIDPFVLACNSKHAKLAITGAICLQRLVASKAIPRGRLSDVLDAFQEASQQGYDVQLKILQALPSLLQLYASELQGDPLSKLLSLCGGLASSKTGLVSNTAGATFQQLITSVFERVASERKSDEADESGHGIAVSDASKVFADMCMVVRTDKPQFLHSQEISVHLALEVIENSLANDDLNILDLPNCISMCETHLVPGIATALEKANNYKVFGQCLRVTYLLATTRLLKLTTSMADVFNAILDWLDRGTAGSWRRVLCLELMRDLCSDFDTLRLLYAEFDQQDGNRNVVQDLMGTMVRIASEDPSLIGLGRQSTVPTNTSDSASSVPASVEVSDFDAVGSVMQANSNVTGLSTKWSTTSSPFLEQMDRSQPPEIPETYIYTLVLACAAAFSEGLSKFIMPLTVPSRTNTKTSDDADNDGETPGRRNSQRAQKYQRLQNPLKRGDVPKADEVKTCAVMVEDCWPAVLATCSTFLNSALDSYFYHILVRTVQKLAQVSGVMELLTPRDALLTTLAKVSAPINPSSLIAVIYGNKPAKRGLHDNDHTDRDDDSIKSPVQSTPKPSVDLSRQNLNVRNLLCLRALLNLGIALGPTLSGTSWFIIIQTLQQVEALMSVSPTAKSAQGPLNSHPMQADGEAQTTLSTEIAAVGTASKRMIESTRTYTDTSLKTFVHSLFRLIDGLIPSTTNAFHEDKGETEKRPSLPTRTMTAHKSTRSISGASYSVGILAVEVEFVLKTINDLARVNLHRFASQASKPVSWDLITTRLLALVAIRDIDPTLRLQAASIIDLISIETVRLLEKQNLASQELDLLQQACLQALLDELQCLHRGHGVQQDTINSEAEVHRRLLDALEDIVSHSGDSLQQGWRLVFEILQLTVKREDGLANKSQSSTQQHLSQEMMARILPVAFRTIQLVVADFLRSIDSESLWVLVQLLPLFGMQKNDLNISLTTTTLFWSINGLILEQAGTIDASKNDRSTTKSTHGDDAHQLSEGSALWFATITHLAELTSDARGDVRNGAIRVLLKILDASGEQLTPEMWNQSIQKVLLQPLQLYTSGPTEPNKYQISFSQLLSGTTELITQHLAAIAKGSNFIKTWDELVSIYDSMLARRTVAGHIAVYDSANVLVRSLTTNGVNSTALLQALLRLWSRHHPAELVLTEDSSSSEFAKHAQLFQEIYRCDSGAVRSFSSDGEPLVSQVMISTKRTIMSAAQEKYSSDVKKLSPEQAVVVTNLDILSRLMEDTQNEYSKYLRGLIASILDTHRSNASTQTPKDTTKRAKPSFIGFMMKCIDILRSRIPNAPADRQWLQNAAADSTLRILDQVIRTKYTTMPVNEALPVWHSASTVATELLEAVKTYTSPLEESDVQALSDIIPNLAEAILNAPALEREHPTSTSARIKADEEFDIACFARFHGAVTPLLGRSHFPEHDRKRYILVLFNASLIAKPWFGDITKDLSTNPLEHFSIIRAGSIRKPDFYIRKDIPYEASQALSGLVKADDNAEASSKQTDRVGLAKVAAPYVLLRIAHTIKTFLADQKLRHLNPPPRLVQRELNTILTRALELPCLDTAFANVSASAARSTDGKTHLRLLYPLILQLREFWMTLPRVEFAAWQDDDDGKAVEIALREWSESICQAWTVDV